MAGPLLHALAQNWSWILLRGILAILFGVMALVLPGVTLLTLVMLWGTFAAADGVLSLIAAVRGGTLAPRWWLVLVGIVGLIAGIATFASPGVTALVLLMFIGWYAVLSGAFEIIGAIQVRKEIDNEWMLILHGVVCVLFGLFVLIRPGAGALALVGIIAFYAIMAGGFLIAFALRLRKHATSEHQHGGMHPTT